MKIAIPHENGRLHGHFGGCYEFALVELDPGKKVRRCSRLLNINLAHTPAGYANKASRA